MLIGLLSAITLDWLIKDSLRSLVPTLAITFSPVVKSTIVRVVLALHQLDVKNAFLNEILDKPIFMAQPPGFIDPRHLDHVCRLKKAMYGLLQAPLAWFQRFNSFLFSLGFVQSRVDSSPFHFHRGKSIIYLLLYVDDVIVTGNDFTALCHFISRTHQEFAIKDLVRLNYFLGLEVSYTTDGLFVGQAK